MGIKETDLYLPIKKFLEEDGFQVQAEVKDCDIAAVKEGKLIIVELKKAFNLKLVYQGLERQGLTEEVYLAIPRPVKGQRERAWKDMLRLLKRLELGLMTVALDSPLETVDVVLAPADSMVRKNRKKRERLEREMVGRNVDDNIGGMSRRKIMTAYREKAIALCCLLEKKESITPKELREMGLEEKYATILRSNVNGWFYRKEKGLYGLSQEGKEVLAEKDYQKAVSFYRGLYEKEGDT